MLQAAKTCSDTHECSACITVNNKNCEKPLCEFLIDTLDTEGYNKYNPDQMLSKWAEKEHLTRMLTEHNEARQINPDIYPEIIMQDSFTKKIYNYVNNSKDQDKLEMWLDENIKPGLVIRTEPTVKTPNNKNASHRKLNLSLYAPTNSQ